MPQSKRLSEPVAPDCLVLVDEAVHGRLTLCVGAGISIEAGLPDGKALAALLHSRLDGKVIGYECADPESLLAVAEAGAALPGGLEAIQRIVLELAPFSSAEPCLSHVLLALLVAEGAVRLLLTNWDDCVERGWRDETIEAARRQSEAEALRGQYILKIHGCCTQADTLLITPAQLAQPGLWTVAYFSAEVAISTLVFVGIGDVANYARKRISELADLVQHTRIRVVSPSIDRDWAGGVWSDILPDLPDERRVATTASEFLDQLARSWVTRLLERLTAAPLTGSEVAIEAVREAFSRFTALQSLRWFRRAARGWKVGESVVQDPAADTALEAIALLAGVGFTAKTIRFLPTSAVLIGERRLEVLLCRPRSTASDVVAAALQRASAVAASGGPQPEVAVLCSAAFVRGPKPATVEATNVVDPDAPVDDLVDGPRVVPVSLVFADDIVAAA